MLYTSYFAMLKKLPKDVVPVAICGKSPDWYTGLQYKKLAPKYDFFIEWKKNHDNDYYIRNFKAQVLDKLNYIVVLEELKQLAKTDNIALICYEKPSDFCHRHLVAKWFKENGIDCEEFSV